MKVNIKKEKCKYCGKDTSDLDFMAMDTETHETFHVCVDCLQKAQGVSPLKKDGTNE